MLLDAFSGRRFYRWSFFFSSLILLGTRNERSSAGPEQMAYMIDIKSD